MIDWRWPGSVLLVNVLEKKVSISLTPFSCLFIDIVEQMQKGGENMFLHEQQNVNQ